MTVLPAKPQTDKTADVNHSDVIPAGENDPIKTNSPSNEANAQTGIKLDLNAFAKYFSDNELLISLFLELCFLLQRNNTAALSVNDLQVHHTILMKLHKEYGLTGNAYRELMRSISNDEDMGKLLGQSKHLAYIRGQHHEDYARIIANYTRQNGYLVTIQLTGDPKQDYTSLSQLVLDIKSQPILNLSKQRSDFCQVQANKNWQALYDELTNPVATPKNQLVLSFSHDDNHQGTNIRLYKAVFLLKELVAKYQVDTVSFDDLTLHEQRPSPSDALLNTHDFLSFDNSFISIQPHTNDTVRPTLSSDVVIIQDVASDDKEGSNTPVDEDATNTNETAEQDSASDQQATPQPKVQATPEPKPSLFKRLFSKIKPSRATQAADSDVVDTTTDIKTPPSSQGLPSAADSNSVATANKSYSNNKIQHTYRDCAGVMVTKPIDHWKPVSWNSEKLLEFERHHLSLIFSKCVKNDLATLVSQKQKAINIDELLKNGFDFQCFAINAGFYAKLRWQANLQDTVQKSGY